VNAGEAIRAVLLTAEPAAKVMAARKVARDWRLGRLAPEFAAKMPDRPARPARPELLPPGRMPRRGKGGSERGRIALWHALAHIEFVAIDLALDMAGRFGGEMGGDFLSDFLAIKALGSGYGALPAHGGLWQAAADTAHDVAARLAVVPMVLEARGLDVTPATLDRVRQQGDTAGARILQRILDDEIRHVAVGVKFLAECARRRGINPEDLWISLVRRHFRGGLKPPFNDSARSAAGLSLRACAALAS
jgi:uncharacterized ferritin-like protein (DUF455 family)